jgi:hypothetical protein
MAQLVEQRIRNAWVRGSSPLIGFLNLISENITKDKSAVCRFIFVLMENVEIQSLMFDNCLLSRYRTVGSGF